MITTAGAQESLVRDLSWLPDYQNILFTVSHRPHGRTILFRNRHKVEFGVLDTSEVSSGKIERYRVLIDRDRIAELIGNVHIETHRQATLRPEALENFCVLVWSACELYARGEVLHARQYVDGFAINQLLNILYSESADERRDALDPRRRLEKRSPELAAELLELYAKPVPDAALRLLEISVFTARNVNKLSASRNRNQSPAGPVRASRSSILSYRQTVIDTPRQRSAGSRLSALLRSCR